MRFTAQRPRKARKSSPTWFLGWSMSLARRLPARRLGAISTLYSFPVSKHGTISPISGLVSDTDGALYGTFVEYSTPGKTGVFKLTPPAEEGGRLVGGTHFHVSRQQRHTGWRAYN